MTQPIFINGRFLSQKTSGVQRYCREILKALDPLASRLPPLVLLTPPDAEEFSLAQIEIKRVGSLQGNLWEQWSLPQHTRDHSLLCLANTAPLRHRGPLNLVIHDMGVYATPNAYSPRFRAWYRFLLPRLARRASIFSVSEFSREEIARYLPVDEAGIGLIPCGGDHLVDLQPDQPEELAELARKHPHLPEKFILAVTSPNPNKNLHTLAQAFRSIDDSSLGLVLVGGGSQSARIFRASPALDDPRIHWVCDASDRVLKALYERACLFVFPSTYEGFGIPPLEALHCGCPTLVSDIRPFRDQWQDSVDYCDPRSPERLAEQMKKRLDEPPPSRASTETAWRSYTWENAARKLADALLTLA